MKKMLGLHQPLGKAAAAAAAELEAALAHFIYEVNK
jgi:hypothetical protein